MNGSDDPTIKKPLVSTSGRQFVVALFILSTTIGVLLMLGFVTVPKENQTVLNVVVGNIMGFTGATIAFYFPSSVGARSKDEAITKLADQLTAPPAPGTTTTTTTTAPPIEPPA